MANKKVTELTANTAPVSTDLLTMVDDPGGTPLSQKITFANASKAITPEGTNVLSTGEAGGVKFLREDGDGTSSWQAIPGGGDALTSSPLSQFAATTSLQLKGVLSDETGSGAAVFADTPTLVTPNIGVATATSVNKVAITAPATGSTLTIPDGVTLTGPAASGTAMTLGNAETVTGEKTFGSAGAVGKLKVAGTTSGAVTLDTDAVAGTAVVTIPAVTDTLVGKATTDTLTNKTLTTPNVNEAVALTATSTELNVLDGIPATLTATEIGYLDGVTSAIQTQLDGKLDDAQISDVAYDATTWNGNTDAPTKNAVRDKFESLSSGGQVLVTHIVAASGGTHTTLGAAITAASNGDTIWVREGTYSESAITTALTDITIIGENPSTSIISIGANAMTFSGTNVTIKNVAISSTTGAVTMSGTYARIVGCNLTVSGNVTFISLSNTGSRITGCNIFDTNTSTHSAQTIATTGTGCDFSHNYCSAAPRVGDNATGWLRIGGSNNSVIGNKFYLASVAASSVVLSLNASRPTVMGNNFNTGAAGTISRIIYQIAGNATITGNTFADGICAIYNIYDAKIIGNDIHAGGSGGVGIEVQGAYVNVMNNRITAATTCVNVGATTWTKIHGNYLASATNGVVTNASATYTDIIGNTFNSNLTNLITDNSPSTNIRSNTGLPITLEKHMYRMKNTSGGALAAGNVVTIKAVAAGDEVTTTTTASDNLVYGVSVEAPANNAYGYVQTLGKTTVLKVDGTTDIAIGDFLTTFTTAGIAAKGASGNMVFAIALEAYTANDSNGIIDALLINPRQMA